MTNGPSGMWLTTAGVMLLLLPVEGSDPFQSTPTITAVEFSPDGKHVLVGNSKGSLALFDVLQKKWGVARFADSHSGLVRSVMFLPNGKLAASAGEDSLICFWDALSGKRIMQVRAQSAVNSISCSKDGKYLLSGEDKGLFLRDASTGKEIRRLSSEATYASALSNDGALALSAPVFIPARGEPVGDGDGGCSICLRDTSSAETLRKFKSYKGRAVFQVAFSPAGDQIICVGGSVSIWDRVTGASVAEIRPPGLFSCESARFTPTGRFVVTATMGEQPRLLGGADGPAGTCLAEQTSYQASRRLAHWSMCGIDRTQSNCRLGSD